MTMARIGITKKQVEIAKEALLARKQAVTIDAVRQELGNTGSKTTISRYLNELAEDTRKGPDSLTSLSEELAQLVANIANRLESEAKDIVVQNEVKHQNAITQWQEKYASLASDVAQYQDQVGSLTAKLSKQVSVNHGLEDELNTLKLAHAQLVEKEAASQQRLAEKQTHIASLEEKHIHAREALQYFRDAAKEQRDQEQTRHEYQLQQAQAELQQANQMLVTKQGELATKNKAFTTLETTMAVRDSQLADTTTQIEKLKIQLEDTLERLNNAQSVLVDKEKHYAGYDERLGQAESTSASLQATIDKLVQENITVKSTLQVKEEMLEDLMQLTQHEVNTLGNIR